MSNCYYSMCKAKCFPFLLAVFLMFIHFLSSYPGGVTPDSFLQFEQSLTGKFSSHNPPLMAMLWSVFNHIYAGPQIMLLFHLVLLWGGTLFLYMADDSNKYRWIYFIMPFVPNILSESTMIWKDISFGDSLFFAFAACVYYSYQDRKAPLWASLIFLLVAFYALSVKFQAQFILPVLIFFIITISTHKALLFRMLATAFLFFTFIFCNNFVTEKFAHNSNAWQLRQFFDIAAIAKDLDDDSMMPDYVTQSSIYNFETLKKNSSHKWVDDLIYTEEKVYLGTQDSEKLSLLNQSFYNTILSHPLLYLKHRVLNFSYLMGSFYKANLYAINNFQGEIASLGIDVREVSCFKKSISLFLKIYPNILRINLVALLLILLYISTISWKVLPTTDDNILRYVVIISVLFSLTLFFTTMSSDYRYYYIVRLLSFFSIPIYLKTKSRF